MKFKYKFSKHENLFESLRIVCFFKLMSRSRYNIEGKTKPLIALKWNKIMSVWMMRLL